MKKLSMTLIVIFFLFTITGCVKNKVSTKGNDSIASALMYNNTYYYPTADTISSEDLDKQIGVISKQVTPFPKNNGESNVCSVGSKIFEIKGINTKEAIAVYFHNGYHKAITMGY